MVAPDPVLRVPGPVSVQVMGLDAPVSVAVKSVELRPAGMVRLCGATVRFCAGGLMVMVAFAVRVPAVAVNVAVVDAARPAGGV